MASAHTSRDLSGHQALAWNLLKTITATGGPGKDLQGFGLRLADGSRWWLAGYPPASTWVEKLAPVMHLHPEDTDGANLIVFVESPSPSESASRRAAPDSGWLSLQKGNCILWYRLDSPDLLIEWVKPLSEAETYVGMRDSLAFVYWQSLRRGGIPFHAGLAVYRGQGVILAGASGTGKSTCCRRLSPPWQALADDEVLVALTPEGRYVAHPFPTWSDYLLQTGKPTYSSQEPVPAAGLFFLEQASQDECLPLSPAEALVEAAISAQVCLAHFLWYCGPEEARNIRALIFANACELVKKVPAFRLRVSLSGRFWEQLEAVLETR
ncbi:MAG: SynChlorMet cassette protein ScmC [Desulfobaccales bacterium]